MSHFNIIDSPQRSAEWYAARAGRLTGSMAHAILMSGKKKGEESKTRRDYRLQLVAERIAGASQERLFWTADMQRGVDLEPLAFGIYEAQTGAMVQKTGFLQHKTLMAGCSLDGHMGHFSGIIELKCPKIATHLTYLNNPEGLRADYEAQVRHNLWITGAAFCDLVSFDNRFPERKQLVRVRIEAYDARLKEYEAAALEFLSEVEAAHAEIMGLHETDQTPSAG
jgi:exodeoxyribonuclease (lambda-induced)